MSGKSSQTSVNSPSAAILAPVSVFGRSNASLINIF